MLAPRGWGGAAGAGQALRGWATARGRGVGVQPLGRFRPARAKPPQSPRGRAEKCRPVRRFSSRPLGDPPRPKLQRPWSISVHHQLKATKTPADAPRATKTPDDAPRPTKTPADAPRPPTTRSSASTPPDEPRPTTELLRAEGGHSTPHRYLGTRPPSAPGSVAGPRGAAIPSTRIAFSPSESFSRPSVEETSSPVSSRTRSNR